MKKPAPSDALKAENLTRTGFGFWCYRDAKPNEQPEAYTLLRRGLRKRPSRSGSAEVFF